MVQSLAAQSFRGLGEAGRAGRVRFEPRLFALSTAHIVLTLEHWSGADLHTIVKEIVQSYDAERSRLVLEGSPVRLSWELASASSMILHELCTNWARSGVLSNPGSRVTVTICLLPCEGWCLQLAWSESGGLRFDRRAAPRPRGFGSRLSRRGLFAELGGATEIRIEPTDVICEVKALLSKP